MEFTITNRLRNYLVKELEMDEKADDKQVRDFACDAIDEGKLKLKKLRELTEKSDAEKAVGEMVNASVAQAIGPVAEQFTKSIDAINATLAELKKPAQPAPQDQVQKSTETGTTETKSTETKTGDNTNSQKAATLYNSGSEGGHTSDSTSANNTPRYHFREKSVAEWFDNSRTALTYEKSKSVFSQKSLGGQQVTYGGRGFDVPTELDKAIAGAWFKHTVIRSLHAKGVRGPEIALPELDQKLVYYAAEKSKFVGDVKLNGVYHSLSETGERLPTNLAKALVDDSTSGGLEAVPIEFDSAVILTPLLHSEIFPRLDLVPANRRRMEAVKIGNPTLTWGNSEPTPISLFNTDSFITAMDTTIHVVDGAMQLGLDFLADSPVAVGMFVEQNYGERFKQELDNVVVNGDGTNQPEGVFQASGTTSVTPAGGAGTAPQWTDYEALYFGVPKEIRNEARGRNSMVFIGTDTAYKRFRGIPVDTSNDARRLEQTPYDSYMTSFGIPYAVNEDISNATFGCVALHRYRMYQRMGMEVMVETSGFEAARSNSLLIVVRGRFGGQLNLATALAKITTGQA